MANERIGHASLSEKGTIYGAVGDQTGREVHIRSWYNKGWDCVLRPISPEVAEKSARLCEAVCKNDNVGYSQSSSNVTGRNSLRRQLIENDWNPDKIAKCNCDCSSFMAVCAEAAGVNMQPQYTSGNAPVTSTMRVKYAKTGAYKVLTDRKYRNSPDYLLRGDILLREGSHTAMVLDNGAKAGSERPEVPYKLGDRLLRNGDEGADVQELQTLLIRLSEKQNDTSYLVGSYGADGDFGDSTESAVRSFQRDYALSIDGIVGAKTLDRLYAALESGGDGPVQKPEEVRIFGGTAYIRTKPDASGAILGTVHSGDRYPYAGETSENGWNKIVYAPEAEGWVSGKYSRIEGA